MADNYDTIAGGSENFSQTTATASAANNQQKTILQRSVQQNRSSLELKQALDPIYKDLKASSLTLESIEEYLKDSSGESKKREKEQKEQTKALKDIKETFKDGWKDFSKSLDSLFQTVEKSISTYTQYSLRVNSALTGISSYSATIDKLNSALAGSGSASVISVLQNVANLTSKGIVNNVEQRAFLQTISEGIASTFDAMDDTLLRLIKLQNADSTENRLALQASLKEYLNTNYKNSQYLVENYKTVSANIIEATSLLSSSQSLGVESTIQKWLGSLSSSGLSSSAVGNLSSALGSLGSGNLSQLSGTGMQSLLIMGANRAGLSYADLLTGGLTQDKTNKLMYGITSYLSSLSGNNVVMSEYARLFGLSSSDLLAARNAASNLSGISGANISSSNLGRYLNQYNEYMNATPALFYQNLIGNLGFSTGQKVATNMQDYQAYEIGKFISNFGTIGNVIGKFTQLGAMFGLGSNLANSLSSLAGSGVEVNSNSGYGWQVGTGASGLTHGSYVFTPEEMAANQKDTGTYSLNSIWKGVRSVLGSVVNTVRDATTIIGNIGSYAIQSAVSGSNVGLAYDILKGRTSGPSAGGLLDQILSQSGITSGSASTSGSAYGGSTETTVSVQAYDSALGEAEWGINDLYEFLTTDAVAVTPYYAAGDAVSLIVNYNSTIASNTQKILALLATWYNSELEEIVDEDNNNFDDRIAAILAGGTSL